LAARLPHPHALEPEVVRALINATGGHGGLLKAAFFVTQAGETALEPDLIESLSTNPSLIDECHKIWDSLDKRDHDGLLAAVANKPIPPNAQTPLMAKGLLIERTDDTHAIFCPVFENYVRQKAGLPLVGTTPLESARRPEPEPHLEIYQGSRLVRINKQEIVMTRAEFELLCRLVEMRGKDCRREDLLERVLAAETAEPSNWGKSIDDTLDQAAAEIKHKLEAHGFAQSIIVSVDGGGYRMN
jgi:DNA-binding winged helix-turn-helix (wHTH) protein